MRRKIYIILLYVDMMMYIYTPNTYHNLAQKFLLSCVVEYNIKKYTIISIRLRWGNRKEGVCEYPIIACDYKKVAITCDYLITKKT